VPDEISIVLSARDEGISSVTDKVKNNLNGVAEAARKVESDGAKGASGLRNVGDAANHAATQAEGARGKLGGLGSALGSIATIASGFVVAQGLMKIPGILGGAVDAASDLNESLSKVQVVFGEGAGEVEKWADGAANAMGQSKQAALEAAGTFGNFLQAMGQTPAVAKDMSLTMVQLAGDLASFNNANPEEVIVALRAGLSGEAEPMKKFGVALSEAAVSAKAAQMGIAPLGATLTEQQKIAARYAIILDQTKTAQGDFARTADGAANKQRILAATAEDLSAKIGQKLLPAKIALMGFMVSTVLPGIDKGITLFGNLAGKAVELGSMLGDIPLPDFSGKIGDVISDLQDFAGTLTGVVFQDILSGDFAAAWEDIGFAIGELSYQLTGSTASFDAITTVFENLREIFDNVKPAVEEFASGSLAGLLIVASALAPIVVQLATQGFGVLSSAVAAVRDAWNGLPDWAKTAIEISVVAGAFVALAGPVLALGAGVLYIIGRWDELNAKFPIIGQTIDAVQHQFEKFNNDVVPAFKNGAIAIGVAVGLITAPLIALGGVVAAALIAVVNTFREDFDEIKNIVKPAFELISGIVKNEIKVITDVINVGLALMRGDWSGAWDAMKQLVSDIWSGMKETVRNGFDLVLAVIRNAPVLILDLTKNFVDAFSTIAHAMIDGMVSAIGEKVSDVVTAIWHLKDNVISGLGNAADWLRGVGQQIIQGLIQGIEDKLGDLWGVLGSITSKIPLHKGPPEVDRELLRPSGQMIIQGLATGMQDEMPGVIQTLETFTGQIAMTAAATASVLKDVGLPVGGYDGHAKYNPNTGQYDLTGTAPNPGAGIMANFDVGMFSPVPLSAGERMALGDQAYNSYINGLGVTASVGTYRPSDAEVAKAFTSAAASGGGIDPKTGLWMGYGAEIANTPKNITISIPNYLGDKADVAREIVLELRRQGIDI